MATCIAGNAAAFRPWRTFCSGSEAVWTRSRGLHGTCPGARLRTLTTEPCVPSPDHNRSESPSPLPDAHRSDSQIEQSVKTSSTLTAVSNNLRFRRFTRHHLTMLWTYNREIQSTTTAADRFVFTGIRCFYDKNNDTEKFIKKKNTKFVHLE